MPILPRDLGTFRRIQHFLLLFLVLISLELNAKPFCDGYESPVDFLKIKSEIDEKIRVFSRKKSIAEPADMMLSKLISAKSPVILSWLDRNGLNSKSEDEMALAWREYFARNLILTKYPHGHASIDSEIQGLVDGVLTQYFKPVFINRMEKLFERAKASAVQTLQSFSIPQNSQAIDRLKKVKLYWPKDLKSARNNAIPLDLIGWGIAYDPIPNEINMGINSLSYPNDETYLAVFAHELGHAIDSCRWGAFLSGEWPFEKVGTCLRSPSSVGAKRRDDSGLEKLIQQGKLAEEIGTSLKQNPTCNRLIYPPPGVQADQLPEAFADWFSAEVIAQFDDLNFLNLRRDLCAKHSLVPGSSYPENSDRLAKIYFSHPKFKGKKPSEFKTAKYCRFGEQ